MNPASIRQIAELQRRREQRSAEQLRLSLAKQKEAEESRDQARRAHQAFETIRRLRQGHLYGSLPSRCWTAYDIESLNAKIAGLWGTSEQLRDRIAQADVHLEKVNTLADQARVRYAAEVRRMSKWEHLAADLKARQARWSMTCAEVDQEDLVSDRHRAASPGEVPS